MSRAVTYRSPSGDSKPEAPAIGVPMLWKHNRMEERSKVLTYRKGVTYELRLCIR